MCGHWGFQMKCVSRTWELSFLSGDGLGGGELGHLREGSQVLHHSLLSSLGTGTENEERSHSVVCCRTEEGVWGFEGEEREVKILH